MEVLAIFRRKTGRNTEPPEQIRRDWAPNLPSAEREFTNSRIYFGKSAKANREFANPGHHYK